MEKAKKRSLISLTILLLLFCSLFLSITPNVRANSGIFGNQEIGEVGDSINVCRFYGSVFTISETGTADNITVALRTYSAWEYQNVTCAIYKHNDLSLVEQTQERLLNVTQTPEWFTFNFTTKPDLIKNTDYILCAWADGNFYIVYIEDSETNQCHYVCDYDPYNEVNYFNFNGVYPDPMMVERHYNQTNSIYCSYTPDTEAPAYSNIGISSTLAREPCTFTCLWQDNIGLSGFIFSTNRTSTWKNETWKPLYGIVDWAETTKDIPDIEDEVIGYRWFCNDTNNNWNSTAVHLFLVSLNPYIIYSFGCATTGPHYTGSISPNATHGGLYTLTEWAKVYNITVAIRTFTGPYNGGQIKCGFYHKNYTFINETLPYNLPTLWGTFRWYTTTFETPLILAPGDYYIAVLIEHMRTLVGYDTGASTRISQENLGDWPDPMMPTRYYNSKMSIYASYTKYIPPIPPPPPPEFMFPLLFAIGIIGIFATIGGPVYAYLKIKKHEYYDGLRTGFLLHIVGLAFTMAWLWS